MKKLLATIIMVFALFIFSTPELKAQEDGWKLRKEVNGVQIYEKLKEDRDSINDLHQEIILLKFLNTTSQDIKITWKLERWYGNKCVGCDSLNNAENTFSITLDGGEEERGVLKIFRKFLNRENKEILTKYRLKNINTEIY